VWGFTAGVLARLLVLGGCQKPWDSERVVDLPQEALRLAMRQHQSPAAPPATNGGV